MAGCLYVVATPLGNLGDMTFRGVEVLKSVDAIACEDTRHTRKLLDHFGIAKPLFSYHEHNEKEQAAAIASRVEKGEEIALVSDAGTPLISDPGYRVVRAVCERGLPIVPVPGPSALLTALSVSGLPTDSFYFGGFLPRKSAARHEALKSAARLGSTLVFYEAPHRILESLSDIASCLGDPAVVVCRELTKLHEEILRGSATEIRADLERRSQVLGEFTIVIEGRQLLPTAEDSVHRIHELEGQGMTRMEAIKAVARETGQGKRELYRLAGIRDAGRQ